MYHNFLFAQMSLRQLSQDSDNCDTASLDPSMSGDIDSLDGNSRPPSRTGSRAGSRPGSRISSGQSTPLKELPSTGQGAFVNFGFQDSLEEACLSQAFLDQQMSTTKNTVVQAQNEWKRYHEELCKNHEAVKEQIQNRKEEMIEMVRTHANKLDIQLNSMMQTHEKQAQTTADKLKVTLEDVVRLEEGRMGNGHIKNGEDDDSESKSNVQLYHDLQDVKDQVRTNTPIWLPFELKSTAPTPYLLTHLFGSIQVNDSKPYSLRLCKPLQLINKFSVKTKFDGLPCGLVDMAITMSGDILVADKQNKLLKMFSSDGFFKKIVDPENLKDPTRLTVLKDSGNILITDNYIRFVKLFDAKGTFVKNFLNDLKYPTSMCESYNGDIIISEYESKCMIVVSKNGKHQYMFPTKLLTPAHVACGPRGHVAVTDWRNHTIKAFQLSGETLWEYKEKGSGEKQLDQPQGICFDPLGNILIADTKNHRIQCLNESGTNMYSVLSKVSGIKLPMSVHCDNNGLLYIAEYQGVVKIYKYLEKYDALEDEAQAGDAATNVSDPDDIFEPGHTVCAEDVKLTDGQHETPL